MDYSRRSICFAARLVLQRQPREGISRLIAWLSPHHFACPEQSIGASCSGKTNGVVAANVMRNPRPNIQRVLQSLEQNVPATLSGAMGTYPLHYPIRREKE
jgi:hypothetical protein